MPERLTVGSGAWSPPFGPPAGQVGPAFPGLGAGGVDEREVVPGRPEKSVSHEQIFDENLHDLGAMQIRLLALAEKVGARLRRKRRLRGATITVKIRTGDWQTCTRRHSLAQPTASTREIHRHALALLEQWRSGHPGDGVRLPGVGVSALAHAAQGALFETPSGGVDVTLDDIRARFGGDAIVRGSLVDRYRR